MAVRGRWKSVFFISLGSVLVGLAIALNVGWILLNWREVAMLVLGIVFFFAIIAGLVLNTIFLVREIRRNEQHDAFINAVTHELKTPIASIKLYLETLKTRDVDEQQRNAFYDVMLSDSDRLLSTVEQVLRAGQTGEKQRHLARQPVDVGELARDAVDEGRTRAGQSTETIRFSDSIVDRSEAMVLGDPDELRVAISNLLDNAVKYSGKTVDIDVGVAAADDRHVAVTVSDHGVGIAPDELKRIFKRFYRVPGAVRSRAKGTGLGLFIVRSIVDRHRGRVFATSAGEGQGTRFTIELRRMSGR
ncbi:MAG TPA: HAMP domain-containing sensor histidine kinase [Blastocatellia bacterium]|nr:HAMP domain-containing sensor histidine kinase [Blastocatellia bacterium]